MFLDHLKYTPETPLEQREGTAIADIAVALNHLTVALCGPYHHGLNPTLSWNGRCLVLTVGEKVMELPGHYDGHSLGDNFQKFLRPLIESPRT